MKRVIVRVLFLHELSCSEVGLHDVEAGRNVAQTERCAFSRSLRCGYGLACDIAYENSLAGVCAANGEKIAVKTSVESYGAVRGESYGCLRALHVCSCHEVEAYALVLGVESVNRTVRTVGNEGRCLWNGCRLNVERCNLAAVSESAEANFCA